MAGHPAHDQPFPVDAQPQSNGLGVAGFILSLLGLITCFTLSPIGLVLSLFGLTKQPRGLAIAGTIIGVVGSVLLGGVVSVIALFYGLIGGEAGRATATGFELGVANVLIEEHRNRTGNYPTEAEVSKQLDAFYLDFTDGWGKAYRYETFDDGSYELRSAGPDGQFDTDDDVLVVMDTAASAPAMPAEVAEEAPAP